MDLSAVKNSRVYSIFIIWHLLATLLSLIIGVSEGDFSLFISLVIWTAISFVIYSFRPKYFIPTAFILSVIEEILVYQMGGGLQGKALSLTHDLINALPVFLGIIVGWYFMLRRYDIKEHELYLLAGSHGIFVELLFQGYLFNPILLFLLGGPTFFIYGSIMVIPKPVIGERNFGLLQKIFAWTFVLIMMLVGAIVADNLNPIFGYQ